MCGQLTNGLEFLQGCCSLDLVVGLFIRQLLDWLKVNSFFSLGSWASGMFLLSALPFILPFHGRFLIICLALHIIYFHVIHSSFMLHFVFCFVFSFFFLFRVFCPTLPPV